MPRYNRFQRYNVNSGASRYRPILIIVLVLVAAFIIFKVAGVGGINESNFEAQRNSRLRSEVQHAVSSVNSLSRLGASSTSSMLGRIRQYVHGVEVIPNVIDRPNRYDLLIRIAMDESALPLYDACDAHHRWKDEYGALIEKKAIFDCE